MNQDKTSASNPLLDFTVNMDRLHIISTRVRIADCCRVSYRTASAWMRGERQIPGKFHSVLNKEFGQKIF